MGFIDTVRAEGHAVESICQVLREQGCPVAARTYRSWKQPDRRVADRTVTDAMVVDMIRGFAWRPDLKSGEPKLTAEGLYGRRKMTALLRRAGFFASRFGPGDRPRSDRRARWQGRSPQRRLTRRHSSNCPTPTRLTRLG